ncbi:MAG: diguanylate cyclase domain-containing protein, partial [Pontibacterium sp.]
MNSESQSTDNLKELLSEPLFMLPPSASLRRASALMQEQGVSSLLVQGKDEPNGIITERDILIASAQQVNPNTPVSDFMSSPVISVTESAAVRQGHNLLNQYNIRHLLITDEAQAPLGILSTSDFRSRLASSFLTRLRSIKRLMSHWFIALPAETPAQQLLEVMAKRDASCIVITRNRKPCGLITEADTVKMLSHDMPADTAAQDIMSTQVQTVKLDTSVPEVLALFQHQASRYLVVVDNEQYPVGLISEHDIIRQIELHFAANRETQKVALVNREHHYEHKYQAIFDTTNAFLILLNPEGQVVEINGAAQEMFGCSYESIIGKPLHKSPRLATENKAQKQLRRAIEGAKLGHFRQLVAEHLDESAQPYWVEYRLQPMLNDEKALELILIEGFDISELKRTQTQLQSQAFYDPLTNLPNRSLLSERMKLVLGQRRNSQKMLAIAYLDLDHFKPVNDKLGHDVGDLLLKEVAKRLTSNTRSNDTVSRLGGDEFVILLPELDDADHAEEVIRHVLRKISEPYSIREHCIEISASIGFTICQGEDADADILMRQADQAMYRAKQLGRNRCFMFDRDENDTAINHLKLVSQLRAGMAAAQLELFYQPKVNMRTSEVIGVEALVRWLHPTRGLLTPKDFLPKLTDHPVMSELDHWVLLQSIRQLSIWKEMGVNLTLNVNISGHSLKNQVFVDTLERLLENHPELPRSFLELEILENTALEQISSIGD